MLRYEIGQTNPPDLLEKKDCMVRAMANALERPYGDMHRLLGRLGRRPRRSTPLDVCFTALTTSGVNLASPVGRRISHARFVAEHPKGRFVVMSRSHAWAIRDGVVFDSWRPGPRKLIRWIGIVPSVASQA